MTELENINADKVRWQNRRRMAWTSLISMILITFLLIFVPDNWVSIERLDVIKEFITWFYFSCTAVVGGYMGVTTYAHIKGIKQQ